MCVGGMANPGDPLGMEGIRKTRDNVNNLFGWGNPGTRGESKPGSVTNIYNYGQQAPKRASLGVKGGGKAEGSKGGKY